MMEKTTLKCLQPRRIQKKSNLWLFPKWLHPAGFVEALPAAFSPQPLLDYYRSPTSPSGSAFQHSNTASPASAGPPGAPSQPLREPAGCLLLDADTPLQQKLLVAGHGKPLAVQTSGVSPGRSTTARESGCSMVRMHTLIARVLGILNFI